MYYAGKSVTTFPHNGNAFPCVIQKYTKFVNFAGLYFLYILKYFATKLNNCMTFRKLFPAVLIDVPNSKVCLIGEWPIEVDVYLNSLNSFHQTDDKYNSSPTKLLKRTDLVETVKCLQ